jgi:hypothetical protein
VRLGVAAFHAILFLQSGIDKVVDRSGNIAWLTSHFAKSPLARVVSPMVTTVTIVEVAAGLASAIGFVTLLLGNRVPATIGLLLSMIGLLMLFFGQRLAKDYAGAAGLVPYFIATCLGLVLMGMP